MTDLPENVIKQINGVNYYGVIGSSGDERPAQECAKCGGDPTIAVVDIIYDEITYKPDHTEYRICCEYCGQKSKNMLTRDDAIVGWNAKQHKLANRFIGSSTFWTLLIGVSSVVFNVAIVLYFIH